MEWLSRGNESRGRIRVFFMGGRYLWRESGGKVQSFAQEWFFGETDQRSIVTIKLKKDGSRTRVELEHTNIPDEVFEEIVEGWKEYYLGSIKGLLEMY